jgi:hypothetical protein
MQGNRWAGCATLQLMQCRAIPGFGMSISCALIFFQANTLGLMLEKYLLHTSPLSIEMSGF